MKNGWKTSLAGVLMILGALGHAYQKHTFDSSDQAAIVGGLGLIAAKDVDK